MKIKIRLKAQDSRDVFRLAKGRQSDAFKQYLRDRGKEFEPSEDGNEVVFVVFKSDEAVTRRVNGILKDIKATDGHNMLTSEEFINWHDNPENYSKRQSKFDDIYAILEKYGDNEVYVDVVYERASDDDKIKITNIIGDIKKTNDSISHECEICGEAIVGHGNNGSPVIEGIVCDDCNLRHVIPARISRFTKEHDNYIDVGNDLLGDLIAEIVERTGLSEEEVASEIMGDYYSYDDDEIEDMLGDEESFNDQLEGTLEQLLKRGYEFKRLKSNDSADLQYEITYRQARMLSFDRVEMSPGRALHVRFIRDKDNENSRYTAELDLWEVDEFVDLEHEKYTVNDEDIDEDFALTFAQGLLSDPEKLDKILYDYNATIFVETYL